MQSSSYYKRKAKECEKRAKELEENARKLNTIESDLRNITTYESVNKEIKDAMEKHANALSGDGAFNTACNALRSANEPTIMQDKNMNQADHYIVAEIQSLNRQAREARSDADDYWDLYYEALAAEADDDDD